MSSELQIILYTPSDALTEHPHLLDEIANKYDLQGIILRSADTTAVKIVQKHGINVYWLAPGLWGHIRPDVSSLAVFADLSAYEAQEYPAYERQFPMVCPNTPGLPAQTAASYVETVRNSGFDGILGTHIRYHHPANIHHLWGCLCQHCVSKAQQRQFDLEQMPVFLETLARKLKQLPVEAWASVDGTSDSHRLVEWWAAITEMDFPKQWFQWKNDTIQEYISQLEVNFHQALPDHFFATNCFEPLLGYLVGNSAETQQASTWYAPLLGYWIHHVQQSLENIATWHSKMSGQRVTAYQMAVIMKIEDLNTTAIPQQISMGSDFAGRISRPYYPVFNGATANQYGVTSDQFSLLQAMKLASDANAKGVILQGISQLLNNPSLDFWY